MSSVERASAGPLPRRSRRGAALLLIGLSAAFAWGVSRLIALRLAAGDVYPAYSSFRADPEGARAFYEALGELPGVTARRNHGPVRQLGAGPKTALLFLGTAPWSLEHASTADVEELETAARSGARLVITLVPRPWFDVPAEPTAAPGGKKSEKKRRKSSSDDDEPEEFLGVSLPERWGFRLLSGESVAETPRVAARLAPDPPAASLPATVPWTGAATVETSDPAWRVIYRRGSRPVLIERRMGHGSIVLSADSTFLSNGALKTARRPELLVWLLDGCTDIVFDETHLGMEQRSGIAGLARRYRLHGLLAGLLFVALLFVWKSAVPFAPASGGPDAGAAVTGRRASEGLAAVLRRHVAPRALAGACLSEWSKSFARSRPGLASRLSGMAAGQDPVAAYNRAAALEKESRTS